MDLISLLKSVPPVVAYVVAAALIFGETGLVLGLAVPGELTLIVVGFLSYTGTLHPVVAVVVMVVAALAGDATGYVHGRRVGVRIQERVQATRVGRWVGPARWARADAMMARGGSAVFIGRFIGFVRTIIPRLAGTAGMPYVRFLPWNLAGVTVQVTGSILVGYLAGDSYALAAEYFGRATGAVALLVVMIVALVLFGRYLGNHPDPVTDFGNRLRRWGPLRVLVNGYDAVFRWLTHFLGVSGAVAANVLLGVGLLLAVGTGLTWATEELVFSSGFPLVDPLVTDWFARQRDPDTAHLAATVLSILRGSVFVAGAGVVGLLLNRDFARWRGDLLAMLGTIGAFLPLLILAFSSEWVRPDDPTIFFRNQVTLVTASVGMVAWLLARRGLPWGARVAVWMVAIGVTLLVGAARLYVGWDRPSQVFASTLLGALWVTIFAVAWATRDKVRCGEKPTGQADLTGVGGEKS